MKRVVAAALGAFVMVGCASAQENATAAPEEPNAFIHAGQVLAVPGEGYLTEQTIVVRDGRIVEVASGYQRVDDDSSVIVIDLIDAYVLPGLAESHVHITSEFRPGGQVDYVLGDFPEDEMRMLDETYLPKLADAIISFAQQGLARTMINFNG